MSRYEVKTSRVGKDGKTYWTRVGVMFPLGNGKDGFSIVFEALQIPKLGQDGQLRVEAVCLPPLERDGDRPARSAAAPASRQRDGLDDDIPF